MSILNSTAFGISEERNFEPGALASEKLRKFLAWWRGASQERVPTRASFDPADHPQLLANLFLVHRDGDDFAFRLYGQKAIDIIGRNYAGHVLSRDIPDPFRRYLGDYYARVLDSGRPWRCSGTLLFAGLEHRRFESIDAPLVRKGPAPDTILGIIDLV